LADKVKAELKKHKDPKIDSMLAQKEEELKRKMKEDEMSKKIDEKKKKGGKKLVVKKGGIRKKPRGQGGDSIGSSAKKAPAPFPDQMNNQSNMPDPNFGARKAVEMDDFPDI